MVLDRAMPVWIMALAALGLIVTVAVDSPALPPNLPTDEPSAAAQERRPSRSADFLFGFPRMSFRIRGGWTFARAGSDIFDFASEQLTIEKGDFSAPTAAIDLSYRFSERLTVALGFEYSRADIQSEFRDYVDMDDQPIVQETRLSQIPLTGSLRLYLVDQGQEISRYAWIPNSFAPYIGAGGGVVWYRLRQWGDFVDLADLSIFTDSFDSVGWSGIFHVFGGMDFKLTPRVFLTFEARYSWADSELGGDFEGFDPIDLTGLRTTAGIDVLF